MVFVQVFPEDSTVVKKRDLCNESRGSKNMSNVVLVRRLGVLGGLLLTASIFFFQLGLCGTPGLLLRLLGVTAGFTANRGTAGFTANRGTAGFNRESR